MKMKILSFVARVFNPCRDARLARRGTGYKPVLQISSLLSLLAASTCIAQTTQSTQPATIPTPMADFELHEWAIFVAEPLAPRANNAAAIKSTLPSFVVSRRPDAQGEE